MLRYCCALCGFHYVDFDVAFLFKRNLITQKYICCANTTQSNISNPQISWLAVSRIYLTKMVSDCVGVRMYLHASDRVERVFACLRDRARLNCAYLWCSCANESAISSSCFCVGS